MNWNQVSIHTTLNSYPKSATSESQLSSDEAVELTGLLTHGCINGMSILFGRNADGAKVIGWFAWAAGGDGTSQPVSRVQYFLRHSPKSKRWDFLKKLPALLNSVLTCFSADDLLKAFESREVTYFVQKQQIIKTTTRPFGKVACLRLESTRAII
jgi:hypothetical protein